MQLPGLHELTPLNSHLISPALAQALGLPPSDGNGAGAAAGAYNDQHNQTQQQQQQQYPAQPSTGQFQQTQQQAAQSLSMPFQDRLMQNAGYDAAQNRQSFGQQYPPSGQGYPSGMGLQQNGGASAGYQAFPHANLYGFHTAMANPYNLSQFQGVVPGC